jgi:hypothetical protein
MSVKNPIRVLKTVRLADAKRVAADRAGNRFLMVDMAQPDAEFLSPGHDLSRSHVHESKPGSRQEEDTAMQTMRYQPNAATPTGPVGRVHGPVSRRSIWQICSWPQDLFARFGSDCQSPDRDGNPNGRRRDLRTLSARATRTNRPTTTTAK